jgi:hypothetical protein
MKKVLGMGLLALVLLPMVGCVGHGYRHHRSAPPPPPRHEMMERGYGRGRWIPGHYENRGQHRIWVDGRWR